jgi:pyruvate/2-oxoglutarate dehydrogenase complex dihydrolipoamide acyltransferase (E2) component
VAAEEAKPAAAERDDAGTVVGAMQSSNAVHAEQALAVGGVKAVPAVRAMARKLGVDLSRVAATGTDGAVTMADVKQAAANGTPSSALLRRRSPPLPMPRRPRRRCLPRCRAKPAPRCPPPASRCAPSRRAWSPRASRNR